MRKAVSMKELLLNINHGKVGNRETFTDMVVVTVMDAHPSPARYLSQKLTP